MIKKPELLAPAGNLEKMKMALLYGADAVYLGGKSFGLRAFGGNFSREELREARPRWVAVLPRWVQGLSCWCCFQQPTASGNGKEVLNRDQIE